jgi:hypothetical protein
MSIETTLKVKRFIVCSSAGERRTAIPEDDLNEAIKLLNNRHEQNQHEKWYIHAEIDV